MWISSLTLSHIRNYSKRTFTFTSPLTIFFGPNAIGKTNILESIYSLSTGGPFRGEKDSDLLQWEEEVGRVSALINNAECRIKNAHGNEVSRVNIMHNENKKNTNEDEMKLELMVTNGMISGQKVQTKKYLVNGISRRKVDFTGHFFSVLFSPLDLELITHSPSHRRNYLNAVLIQTDASYHKHLIAYDHALRQRNALLEAILEGTQSRSQLLFWNQALIEHGQYMTKARRTFIDFINETKSDNLPFRIDYDPSLMSEERLQQYADAEVASHTTLVGPHRDDFTFQKIELLNDTVTMDVGRFGSRGQQRLAILWLKLAEISYIEHVTHQRPILLLDDVFSELDAEHQDMVAKALSFQQTIITTAEASTLSLFPDAEIVRLV